MRAQEAGELRGLVAQAWDLRHTPYLDDAADAIVDWHERRALRRQMRQGALVRMLRETDPDRITTLEQAA